MDSETIPVPVTNGKGHFACEQEDENALNRVASFPVVASTWNALQYYYTGMKKKYPSVSPYLEAAENLTVTAANIALTKSKPVVDKIGPTVNSYANKGLDTLEDKVPIITKQPEEIYNTTKSKATGMISTKVNSALDTTEKYVDYYLPDEDEQEMLQMEQFNIEDDNSESSSVSDDSDEEEEEEQPLGPSERIRNISNKVRQRSYKKAMRKWQGVQVRSREALSKLTFTVDLIQYAQSTFNTSVSAANEKVSATLDGLQFAANTVNKQVEERVLVRARNLSKQLNIACHSALNYVQSSPRLHHLLDQARKAKEATEDLYGVFAGKSSIAELSSALLASTRPKIKLIENTLMQILENLADQAPISWLKSKPADEFQCDPKDKKDD